MFLRAIAILDESPPKEPPVCRRRNLLVVVLAVVVGLPKIRTASDVVVGDDKENTDTRIMGWWVGWSKILVLLLLLVPYYS